MSITHLRESVKLMMKVMILGMFLATAAAYDDIDDTYDYEGLLKNTTRLRDFFECIVDEHSCTENAKHIKEHTFEIITSDCVKCDTVQKHYGHLFMNAFKKFPEVFQQFQTKFDPDGSRIPAFEKAVEKF